MTARTNAEQHAAWNGDSGHRWVANADRRDHVLEPIAELLHHRAGIAAGEHVLDIGCGCGATTIAAATAVGPVGRVVGVDLSAPMLDVARRRTGHLPNLELLQADAQTDGLGGPYDVAISRFGTMFFDDPVAAFANIARHLRHGGRLCMATWQPLEANEWLVVPGSALLEHGGSPVAPAGWGPGMFAQSDAGVIRDVLTHAGLGDVRSEPHTLRLCFGPTVDDAVDYLADSGPGRAILDTIAPDQQAEALDATRHALRPHRFDAGVVLGAAVWITTATLP